MTAPTEVNLIAFDDCIDFNPSNVFLSNGNHGDEFDGACCLIEAANQATRACKSLAERYGKAETFSDDHPSISRVVRAFAIGLNDAWNDEDRQRLRPYVTKVLGTATTPADEETRAWLTAVVKLLQESALVLFDAMIAVGHAEHLPKGGVQ